MKKRLPTWMKVVFGLVLAGVVTFSALLAVVVSNSHDDIRNDPRVMIILGCKVEPWGPSTLLRDRLDKALDCLEERPDMTVVVSGGQGPDEHVSEARCMADYLIDHGVAEEQILLEDASHNTVQNLQNSIVLLAEQGYDTSDEVVIVSNGFHLARVRMLWKRVAGDDDHLNMLAAPSSHAPSRMKMYIREPLALVKSFLLDH